MGRPVHTGEDMKAAIREGFPRAVVQALVEASGLTLQEVALSLDLSVRSLRRPKHEGRLAKYESDRMAEETQSRARWCSTARVSRYGAWNSAG